MHAAGLHFGHDASATLVGGGGVTRFIDQERRTRVKHALGLTAGDIGELLDGVDDIGLVGMSSTQNVPMFHGGGFGLSFPGGNEISGADFLAKVPADHHYRKFVSWMDDLETRQGVVFPESAFAYRSRLNEGFNHSYAALGMTAGQFPTMAEAMHRDGELILGSRRLSARFYQHHYLHAYYAAYTASGTRRSLVLTGDGGIGPSFFGGGVYFWTPGQKLLPVTPLDGWLGQFYDQVSMVLGLGVNAGKLMGLGPYGRALYFDQALVGTRYQVTDAYETPMERVVERWLGRFGVDAAKLPAWNAFDERPPAVIADIAASAQLILERNIQDLTKAALEMARRAGFEFETVTLSGGVALNCPANSNLAVTLNHPVLVPPAVNDEGLSIGAAVAAYFDAFGTHPAPPRDYAEAVYIGAEVTEDDILRAARAHGWRRSEADSAVGEACRRLIADEPVGLCVGKAEVGPRALGHRSILANPMSTETWSAANRLKRREPWRPFAPAVLLERSGDYFDRGPDESRYMLFTYRCNTKILPAITHYDHSARAQHVSAETGLLHDVLLQLQAMGRPPVVLNTSFNGPGTPIVDTAEDAFGEAASLGLNHILTDFGLFSGPRADP